LGRDYTKYNWDLDLLENFALVKLPSLLISACPAHVIFEHVLSLLAVRVQLLPSVGGVVDLPVLRQVKAKFLAFPDPYPGDGRVVVLAKQAAGG
jgi:hypothetical protein